jgi:signal transduction histidine kinase
LVDKNRESGAARRARASLGVIALVVLLVVLAWVWLDSRSLASPPVLGVLFMVGLLPSVILLVQQLRRNEQFVEQVEGLAKSLEQQLAAIEAARERAEISNTAKSTFLANMSHELRTPLNAIIGYAELVAEEIGDRGDDLGELGTDIERILLSARHLLGLINDILDISKIEAGEMRVEIRQVDLARLIKEVRAGVELLIRKRGNQFVVDVEPELGELDSDGMKIRQILINLLGNAAKFTDDGTITLRVTRAGDDGVRFDVIDTGIGIAKHKLELLFEPFVQADASSSRRFGGTGLGLTICRHFADMLDATLTAESEPGKGSTFSLTVPRSRVTAAGSQRAIRRATSG